MSAYLTARITTSVMIGGGRGLLLVPPTLIRKFLVSLRIEVVD